MHFRASCGGRVALVCPIQSTKEMMLQSHCHWLSWRYSFFKSWRVRKVKWLNQIRLASMNYRVISTSNYCESVLGFYENGAVKRQAGSLTRHMGEHVSIQCLQAVSTESQLRKLGQVPEHIRWQVLHLIVPQVEFLVQYTTHLFLWC